MGNPLGLKGFSPCQCGQSLSLLMWSEGWLQGLVAHLVAFKLIFAESSSYLLMLTHFSALVIMGWSGEYVPLNSFQCDSASWWLHATVVPLTGLPWIDSC